MTPFTFFISYRRSDTAPVALLLKNEIEHRLRFVRALVDVEAMQAGQQFPERLRSMIDQSHCTIALIGERWMEGRDADRADEDWVVKELAYSGIAELKLPVEERYGMEKRRVVPLFVNRPPDFSVFDLPDELAYLKESHAIHIDNASWPMAIGPLLDGLAVDLNLKARPDQDKYPTPDPAKARTQPLPDDALSKTLQFDDYDGWYVDNFGDADARYLTKIFEFDDFDDAAAFMSMVSRHCQVLNHHPEWRNVFNHVTVSLTTWDARRKVTIYDLNLALFMNRAAAEVRDRRR